MASPSAPKYRRGNPPHPCPNPRKRRLIESMSVAGGRRSFSDTRSNPPRQRMPCLGSVERPGTCAAVRAQGFPSSPTAALEGGGMHHLHPFPLLRQNSESEELHPPTRPQGTVDRVFHRKPYPPFALPGRTEQAAWVEDKVPAPSSGPPLAPRQLPRSRIRLSTRMHRLLRMRGVAGPRAAIPALDLNDSPPVACAGDEEGRRRRTLPVGENGLRRWQEAVQAEEIKRSQHRPVAEFLHLGLKAPADI